MTILNQITILLVDDDQLVLDDLTNLIPWSDLGFQIIGRAKSAKQALRLFKEFKPKLVITDIIMSPTNGIELISEIKKISPDTFFLVLSSYEDFHYAKSALQMGVSDYLLKTELSSSALEDKMKKISAEINLHSQTRKTHILLELENYFRLSSQNAFFSEPFKEYISKNTYYFFLCSVPLLFRSKIDSYNTPLFTKEFVNHLSYLLELTYLDLLFAVDNFILIGIPCHTFLAETINLWTNRIITAFRNSDCNGCVFYAEKSLTFIEFKKIYLKKRNELEYMLFFMSESAVKIKQDENPLLSSVKNINLPNYETFSEIIKKEDGKKQLIRYLDQLHETKDFNTLRKFIQHCCTLFRLNAKEEAVNLSSRQALDLWAEKGYDNLHSPGQPSIEHYSSHVRNAILYIRNHYSDSSLSIEKIAEDIGISSGRISVLFKQEVSRTINEYITDIRINAAIDLLLHSNYKIYEIADRVGYRSSQYFSQIFLNYTGRKPLDYRKNTLTTIVIGDIKNDNEK